MGFILRPSRIQLAAPSEGTMHSEPRRGAIVSKQHTAKAIYDIRPAGADRQALLVGLGRAY